MLVYFHGGEFKYGGKDLFRPDYLYDSIMANGQEMIVVTINYRLGVLGFLSTDDVNQPGNNGIRDQLFALQWIHQNIGLFQGNPNQVTIMGHDAGGVSVGMHLLNQDAASKFHLDCQSCLLFTLFLYRILPLSNLHQWHCLQSVGI